MAFELTPALAGQGLLASFGAMLLALIIQILMLFWNWKQSKVKNTTEEQLVVLREIRDLLKKKR